MKEGVLFIPGNQDQLSTNKKLVDRLEAQGHRVIPIYMNWGENNPNSDPREWARQIEEQVKGQQFGTIIGHSYGGLAALVFAANLARLPNPPQPFPQLILASHSARFRSDLYGKDREEVRRSIKKVHDESIPRGFQKNRITPLVDAIRARLRPEEVTIFVGGQEAVESPIMLRRANNTARLFGTETIQVEGAGHNIFESEAYIDAVVKQTGRR